MSERTRPGPEQRDRQRRERQRALAKPTASELSADLKRPPHHRPAHWRQKGPTCPECPRDQPCRWDGFRALWTHSCGYTVTDEELHLEDE